MICFLCLEESDIFFNIFDEFEQETYKFTVSEAISNYFQLKTTTAHASLCQKCWNIITLFHMFCLQIHDSHKQLNELKRKIGPESIKSKNQDKEKSIHNLKIDDREMFENLCENRTLGITTISEQEIEIGNTESANIATTQSNILSNNKRSCKNHLSSGILQGLKKEDSNILPNKYSVLHKSKEHILMTDNRLKLKHKNKMIKDKTQKKRTDWYINRKISKFMKLNCNLCNDEISTFKSLQKHFEWKHKESGYVICCGIKFYKRYLLVHHIDFHLTSNNLGVKSNFHERYLMPYYKKEREKKLQCDQCKKSFSRIWTLKQHQAYHTPKETWKFKCENCNKVLPTHCHLNSHIYFTHKERVVQCHICFKSLKAALLNKHLKNHPKKEKLQNETDQGQSEYYYESFHNDDEIYLQYESEDEEIRHYACSICNKLFSSEENLNTHVYEKHSIVST